MYFGDSDEHFHDTLGILTIESKDRGTVIGEVGVIQPPGGMSSGKTVRLESLR